MESREIVPVILRAQQQRGTDIKQRLLDTVGEGEGGMIRGTALKHTYYHMVNRQRQLNVCHRERKAGAL